MATPLAPLETPRFHFHATPLEGLFLVERKPLADERGFFARFWCTDEFQSAGWVKPVVQINHTLTRRQGAVRGMHYQLPPHAEAKLVTCLRGEVFDVAIDLRPPSPTFLHWHAERLTAANQRSLLIPEGFAHGFQALADDSELLYLHTSAYRPEAEAGINPLDPRLAVAWPLEVAEMSPRDRAHPPLPRDFGGIAA